MKLLIKKIHCIILIYAFRLGPMHYMKRTQKDRGKSIFVNIVLKIYHYYIYKPFDKIKTSLERNTNQVYVYLKIYLVEIMIILIEHYELNIHNN